MTIILIASAVMTILAFTLVLWGLFAFEKYKKSLIAEILVAKTSVDMTARPKTVEQFRLDPDRKTLLQYHKVLDDLDRLAALGKASTTSTEIAQIRISVVSLYRPLYKKEHKIKSIISTMGALFLLPVSFWFLIIVGMLWIVGQAVTIKNLQKLEQLMNSYFDIQKKAI